MNMAAFTRLVWLVSVLHILGADGIIANDFLKEKIKPFYVKNGYIFYFTFFKKFFLRWKDLISPEIQLPVMLNLFSTRTTKRSSLTISLPCWHFPHGHVGEGTIQSPGLRVMWGWLVVVSWIKGESQFLRLWLTGIYASRLAPSFNIKACTEQGCWSDFRGAG